MIYTTMQETTSGQMVELFNGVDVQIDTRDGETVRLFAGTYLEVLCTMLPGVIQSKVLDGAHVGRIVFVAREVQLKP